jgi:hypothetical protein
VLSGEDVLLYDSKRTEQIDYIAIPKVLRQPLVSTEDDDFEVPGHGKDTPVP